MDFILKEADADGNGVLDRDEVLASLALWTRLMKMAEPEEPASGFSGWARNLFFFSALAVTVGYACGNLPRRHSAATGPFCAARNARPDS